ncbi:MULTISPECIES: DEAD/DEAH box helicase [Enterococcus]|jgi:SNF2 family DNA or RNA helicase|uniref:DEAD/DEAH box helicase n=1 Tax=Enterococcus TaxID=1350 RepID=UPI000BBBB35C|nr:DEAD/DEAH box helicase [Enterococcus faecium]EGP4887940.1 DEAD/DEAH box helicase [Enterococcus faecium]EGP5092585.1 DEAD/DEAH box helicase [Enterococcus faecium]EGP5131018.1 DEAD/DEAH box helicase [Enterococcus faecium]EME3524874.1 DEAD/DEAH box helicase [Enterococcus faecium]EME8267955.1 DEAD/DEAH box helicase [Enterococcus faecium]
MKYKPHEYQVYATEYILTHPIAAVLLDMGLGKSVITLTAIFDLTLDSFLVRKVLVIAPLRVARDTWPAELEKWDHLKGLKYTLAVGSEVQRKTALMKRAQVYIINRENVEWLISRSAIPFDFDMVVIDELSSFKSHQAKRFKSLLKVRPKIKRIVGLTGTPSSNGLMDLWAEYRLLDMGQRLGRFIGRYREDFFVPDKRNQQVIFSYKPKPGAEEAIYRLISDITISMKGTDYLKLPELVINEVPVKLSEKEMKTIDTMKRDLITTVKGEDITAANAAALSGKLLQMANGAVYDDQGTVLYIHDRKLDALEDLIEAANGKPVLIAYWFKHDLSRIQKRFEVEVLSTSDSIKRWNDGEIPIAAIHPASAGHGLNLQAGGSTLIWFGLTWSLELYQQTNARLWRQGQKETVVIHHLIAKGTIDERVMKALNDKNNTQSALIDAVKATLKEV